jgi:ribonuclease HII
MKNNKLSRQDAEDLEIRRLEALAAYEESLHDQGIALIAGVDEAGRGPLAGPVVAAAAILPPGLRLNGLNDSKQLNLNTRLRLESEIKARAVAWAIGEADVEEIDRFNILGATKLAMKRALSGLAIRPDYLLLDALRLDLAIPQEGIIKGDARCACISAASILAKTYRDRLMERLDALYPQYHLAQNKGYPTEIHRLAVARHGPSPCHRKTFLGFLERPDFRQISFFDQEELQ